MYFTIRDGQEFLNILLGKKKKKRLRIFQRLSLRKLSELHGR